MRMWIQKTFALAVAAALLCGSIVSVSATEEEYYNRIIAADEENGVSMTEGYTIKLLNSADTRVPAVEDTVDEESLNVHKNVVKLELTFDESKIVADQQYVVMLLSGGETIPTNGNIRYIDQDTAEDGFVIYPDQMSQSGEYNVVVSSTSGKEVAAKFTVVEPPYKMGDVDGDNAVTPSDAAKILRMVVGAEENVTKQQELAANVDGDTAVTPSDAAKILRVVVGADVLQ